MAPRNTHFFKSGAKWAEQCARGPHKGPIGVNKYGSDAKPVSTVKSAATVGLKDREYGEIDDLEITNRGNGSRMRRGVHREVDDFGDAHHV